MLRLTIAALAVCLFLAAPSSATVVTTYNSQVSFDSVLQPGFATVDFNSLAALNSSSLDAYSTPDGYTDPLSGIQFVGYNPGGNFLQAANDSNYSLNGTAVMRLSYYFSNSYNTITLPHPVTAVGFDAYTFNPRGGTFVISFPAELGIAPMTFQVTATPGASTWIGL